MRRLLFISILFSFVAFHLQSASASIIDLNVLRTLSVNFDTTIDYPEDETIDSTLWHWDHLLQKDRTDTGTGGWFQGTASQNSTVDLTSNLVISGSLSASVDSTGDTSNMDGHAVSRVSVSFTVTDTPTPYSYGINGIGNMFMSLSDSNGFYGSSGILTPGDYWLYAYVAAGGTLAPASANLSFTAANLSAVPIPSALLLLGSGLIGFVGIKRWFRR